MSTYSVALVASEMLDVLNVSDIIYEAIYAKIPFINEGGDGMDNELGAVLETFSITYPRSWKHAVSLLLRFEWQQLADFVEPYIHSILQQRRGGSYSVSSCALCPAA